MSILMNQVLFNYITIAGVFLTLIALLIAIGQIRGSKEALKNTSELLLRSNKLLFEATRRFANKPKLMDDDREEIIKRWAELLDCANRMYHDDKAWKGLIESMEGGREDEQ